MAPKRNTPADPMMSVGDVMLKIQEEHGVRLKGELEESVRDLVERVKETKVIDVGSYQQADLDCKALKERRDVIEKKLAPYIDAANKIHKFFTSLRAAIFLQLDPSIDRLRREMGQWKQAEDARTREVERRLALKAQEDERARLAKEAELRREQGDEVGAQMMEVQAETAPAPAVVLPSSVPTLEGTSFTTYHRWRPIGGDTPENRKRLALSIIPREFLKIDDVALNAYAERMKGMGKVPGVEFYSEELPTQRRRA
jgi:hypothetical protein